ncbi:MAG: FG-GAP-like repeat-containing protein [Ignavibacteria bacterium]|nr:FG-GAP-like repeat-containing protein [Ignavibacteria bacterium]
MKFFLTLSTLILFLDIHPSSANAQILSVRDIGLGTSFQDTSLGHHKKGRASIAADFDLDGYVDFFIGNPGDESVILRSVPGTGSERKYEMVQVLTVGDISWGGVAFDYDNDDDYDIFITCGANEGVGFDYLFRNDWIMEGTVTGVLEFTDVTEEAGVAGPVPDTDNVPAYFTEPSEVTDDCSGHEPFHRPPLRQAWSFGGRGNSEPIPTASAGAVVADYDQDGDPDLFVSQNIHWQADPDFPELIGRNTLYRNNGDGTFTDVTYEAGLGTYLGPTRHSTFIDYDNDGDQDLFESNHNGQNILWRNNADGTFTDVTAAASAPGHDLRFPHKTFVSAVADLNNDGWEDIISFMRGEPDGQGTPYEDGHAIFMNRQTRFENIAGSTVVNDNYVPWNGVMGCMVGDVTGDGYPDIYVGNGGPHDGTGDQFYTSLDGGESYADNTALIDFAAEIPNGFPAREYPYRTHGVNFVDTDRDGQLEITVVNGGVSTGSAGVREPNRLFQLKLDGPSAYFTVRPVGDGIAVSRDAIGTRCELRMSNEDRSWSVFRTLHGGNAFSAQNGFELHFYLSDATSIDEMVITWPDGTVRTVTEGLSLNSSTIVFYNGMTTGTHIQTEVPGSFSLEQNYPNPFNPSTTIHYQLPVENHVVLRVFDLLGQEVATLVDETKSTGAHSVTWNAEGHATGIYFYSIVAGDFVASRKLILSK